MPAETRVVARTAATWVRKATARLRHDHAPDFWASRFLAGVEAGTLLGVILDAADDLADLLNYEAVAGQDIDAMDEYELEALYRAARELSRKLRGRTLAAKLSNVEGRTPEEAAAFRARALELKGGNGV